MSFKKPLDINYLILSEGPTEQNLFAYLKFKFKNVFDVSPVRFRNRVNIPAQDILNGVLNGISNFKQFKIKHHLVKKNYSQQKIFYFLDKDINESQKIEELILKDGHKVQFIDPNSEYVLLILSGKKLKNKKDFSNLDSFRAYTKDQFRKTFNKEADKFKDADFDNIFSKITQDELEKHFSVLFSLLRS